MHGTLYVEHSLVTMVSTSMNSLHHISHQNCNCIPWFGKTSFFRQK